MGRLIFRLKYVTDEEADEDSVIPEPMFVDGESKLDSFNHKSATVNGKVYPIDRAQHKALAAGNLSVLKDIVK